MDRLNELLAKHRAVGGWLLILAAFASYRGVLGCGFVYDDVQLILENPFIKNPNLWTRIFSGPLFSFSSAPGQSGFYRPLTAFSFWLICRVDGFNPFAYHLVLLVLYALSTWLVYKIGCKLLHNEIAAFAGALLWAVNPLHVEVVAWASSMQDAGCTLFCLAAFWMFLRAEEDTPRSLLRHVAAALVYFPALFFKEMAFSFPILILAYWFCSESTDRWARRLVKWVPYVAALGLCILIRILVMGRIAHHAIAGKRPLEVVLAAAGLLGQHAKLFFWPVNLSEFRDFDLGSSLRSPWPYITLAALAVACAFRRRTPRLSFLLLWWFVCLLPVLNYRQLSIPLVADRFSYTASAGLCLALGFVVVGWLPEHIPHRKSYLAPALTLLAIGVFWIVQTARTIPNWRDNDALFDNALLASPNAAEVHQVHGVVLQLRDHDLAGAAREYRTAIELDAHSMHPSPGATYNAYVGLGQVALLEGREAESLEDLQKAVKISPSSYFAYDVLGSIYFPRGDYERAVQYFEQAVHANPQELQARYSLGLCRMKLGMPSAAAEQFRAIREVDPTFTQAYTAEVAALTSAGDAPAAARVRALIPR